MQTQSARRERETAEREIREKEMAKAKMRVRVMFGMMFKRRVTSQGNSVVA